MRELVGHIDRLLRGQYTRREDLLQGRVGVGVGSSTLVRAGLALGMLYGAFMGLYAVTRPANVSGMQIVATMLKVPLLFLLTLLVTFPSLYVFSALSNSRLRGADTLRLLLAAVTVNLALLASLGTVTAFFTLSTDSYRFLIVLNVAFFAIAGFAGLAFLRRALTTLFEGAAYEESGAAEGDELRPVRRAPPGPDPGLRVLQVWTFTYAIVGAQMAWILRPFIGSPALEFTWFRPRGSNFFHSFWHPVTELFR